jgi:hypothetical protein
MLFRSPQIVERTAELGEVNEECRQYVCCTLFICQYAYMECKFAVVQRKYPVP